MESVDILIEHGTLLTLNAQRHILTDGAVAIAKDRIVAVGKTADLKAKYRRQKNDRRLSEAGDARPVVDGHAHLGEIARGLHSRTRCEPATG